MLETTLSTTFIPGANLKGEAAGANWMFLRPNLSAEQVVCIGVPPLSTLATLASFSQHVTVICRHARQLEELRTASRKRNLMNLQSLLVDGELKLTLPTNSVDLILIVGWRDGWWIRRQPTVRTELSRLLKPQGLLYYEYSGLLDPLRRGEAIQGVRNGGSPVQGFWLTPLRGEMHTAIPEADQATINYFLRQKLTSPSFDLQRVKRVLRFVSGKRQANRVAVEGDATLVSEKPGNATGKGRRSRLQRAGVAISRLFAPGDGAGHHQSLLGQFTQRSGLFIGRLGPDLVAQPPQYLRLIAQEAGISLANFRWGLAAPGAYNSRKLLFFLFDRTHSAPDAPPTYIVKMVRQPSLNTRLENEHRALTALWQKGLGTPETLPQAVFAGHHAGLAMVGETIIDGAPFRQRSKETADCPYGQAALDWLTALGAATADPTATTPPQAAAHLERLLTRFTEIYQVAPAQHTFLSNQLAIIAHSQTALPLVFQHGDPGPWNVMATAPGRIAFLDWEAFEAQGMPLWDLFYFLRSYCVGAARSQGARNTLTGFAQQFLAETPLSHLVIEATKRYCQQVGVAAHLVEPLFYTCWMHRSLKEATRLSPKKLDTGHYLNLLSLCIEQRHSFTLQRLFQ